MDKIRSITLISILLATSLAQSALTPAQIYKKVSTSVVTIEAPISAEEVSQGSGFVLSQREQNGRTRDIVATCWHVVSGAKSVKVTFASGVTHGAKILDAKPDADFALLDVEGTVDPIPKRSDRPSPGERVYAIGAPQGLSGSISEGLMSQARRTGGTVVYQISAAISHGSSGCPIVDSQGRLIGMANSSIEAGQQLNFATPTAILLTGDLSKEPVSPKDFVTAAGTDSGDHRESPPTSPDVADKRLVRMLGSFYGTAYVQSYRWEVGWNRDDADKTEAEYLEFLKEVDNSDRWENAAKIAVELDGANEEDIREIKSAVVALRKTAVNLRNSERHAANPHGFDRSLLRHEMEGTNSGELMDRFTDLINSIRKASWFDQDSFTADAPSVAFGLSFLSGYLALPDFDHEDRARIGWVEDVSDLKQGDVIVGAKLTGDTEFTPIENWDSIRKIRARKVKYLGSTIQVLRNGMIIEFQNP